MLFPLHSTSGPTSGNIPHEIPSLSARLHGNGICFRPRNNQHAQKQHDPPEREHEQHDTRQNITSPIQTRTYVVRQAVRQSTEISLSSQSKPRVRIRTLPPPKRNPTTQPVQKEQQGRIEAQRKTFRPIAQGRAKEKKAKSVAKNFRKSAQTLTPNARRKGAARARKNPRT